MNQRQARVIALNRIIDNIRATEREVVCQELCADGLIEEEDLAHPDVERVMDAIDAIAASLERRVRR